jgi:hypothetical protein
MRIRTRDPDSFLPWIRDPGWKNSDPGSGINIPDQQHRFFYCYRCFDYTAEPLSCLTAGEGDGLHDWSAPDH